MLHVSGFAFLLKTKKIEPVLIICAWEVSNVVMFLVGEKRKQDRFSTNLEQKKPNQIKQANKQGKIVLRMVATLILLEMNQAR